jgi:deoxyribodipyrimidine photolyase-related protein
VAAAQASIAKAFPQNPGQCGNPFPKEQPPDAFYPVDHSEAHTWLKAFLAQRFADFGTYEDALVPGASLLHHSLLSPLLNTGLLRADEVVAEALSAAAARNIPLNSLEGFLRQIIGWRDFIKALYDNIGTAQRKSNFFGANRKMPSRFWTGTTGIVPVDEVIQRLLVSGYNHHIERLMVLGNFMLLCEIHPTEVYEWFMSFYIDAYDWVMVPNVYGMSQFADGGKMATKPYISSSNYIQKMGPYPKGAWEKTWDGLFWRFLQKHRAFFGQNPRLGMLLKTWDKMSAEQQNTHLQTAENFLQNLS